MHREVFWLVRDTSYRSLVNEEGTLSGCGETMGCGASTLSPGITLESASIGETPKASCEINGVGKLPTEEATTVSE